MPPKQDPFLQKKQSILSSNIDLSPKGSIDQLCVPIIKLINDKSDDMVTTSSCSGRLSVFVEGVKNKSTPSVPQTTIDNNNNNALDYKLGGKGDGGEWLFITHNVDEVEGWFSKIKTTKTIHSLTSLDVSSSEIDVTQERLVLYKFEPLILHIKCRDFESASKLYNVAMSCGFRESGIGSNYNVAIRINIKLDVPIGFLNVSKNCLQLTIDETMLTKFLDPLTILKFKENEIKLNELYNKINTELIIPKSTPTDQSPTVIKETKEQRRERKQKEGLLKQLELQNLKIDSQK